MFTVPVAPTLAIATEKAAAPLTMRTIPSLSEVAASMMTSGVGEFDAESRSVFTPVVVAAAGALLHAKLNATLVAPNALVGANAIRNDCPPLAPMFAGVFGAPVS